MAEQMKALIKLRKFKEAQMVFATLENRKTEDYNQAIKIVGSDDANDLLTDMMDSDLVPNESTFTHLLNCHAKCGNFARVDDLLLLFPMKYGIFPNQVHHTVIIHMYARWKRMDLAELAFTNMITQGLHPDIVTFTVLIQGYIDNDEIEKARSTVQRMSHLGILGDIRHYSWYLSKNVVTEQQKHLFGKVR